MLMLSCAAAIWWGIAATEICRWPTAAEMIAMRDDENSIVVEDTWGNRAINEAEIASLIDARSPDPMPEA